MKMCIAGLFRVTPSPPPPPQNFHFSQAEWSLLCH